VWNHPPVSEETEAGQAARRESAPGHRRPTRQWEHFDSRPRQLRKTLEKLSELLEDCEPPIRRRILLMFGELVARWQRLFAGERISADVEFLPTSVRVTLRNAERVLTPADWECLVSAMVVDLVDNWGIDRRVAGSAWFEFRTSSSSS